MHNLSALAYTFRHFGRYIDLIANGLNYFFQAENEIRAGLSPTVQIVVDRFERASNQLGQIVLADFLLPHPFFDYINLDHSPIVIA